MNEISENKQTVSEELNSNQPLIINHEGKAYLITTAKWSNFIAIAGFIMVGVMIVSGISSLLLSPVANEYRDFEIFQYSQVAAISIGLTNIISAVILFFPYLYLYLFSQKTKLGMKSNDQDSLNEGLKNLKRMSKFVGILTIILLAITLLLIPSLFFSIGMLQALI